MRAVWGSLREWVGLVIHAWLFSIATLLAALLWLISGLWKPLAITGGWAQAVAIIALVTASFTAFHRVRAQRDARPSDSQRRLAFRDLLARRLDAFGHVSSLGATESDREMARETVELIRAALGDGEADRFRAYVLPGNEVKPKRASELLEAMQNRGDVRDDFDPSRFD